MFVLIIKGAFFSGFIMLLVLLRQEVLWKESKKLSKLAFFLLFLLGIAIYVFQEINL